MNNNPHSTTSPKVSPTNISLTSSSHLSPQPNDENDNNLNNVDEGFENDNISVTGSPLLANSTEDDERRSSSPVAASSVSSNGGAFTSLIQRNSSSLKKADFLNSFSTQLQQQPHHSLHHQPHQHAFNHALAAQLFLQSPLIPQPSQWLYSQLYGNYDLPWFRSTQQASGHRLNGEPNAEETTARDNLCLAKRSLALISHQDDEHETCASPPVTSTKRTPSPDDDIEIITNSKSDGGSGGFGAIKCRTSKQNDVWRPY